MLRLFERVRSDKPLFVEPLDDLRARGLIVSDVVELLELHADTVRSDAPDQHVGAWPVRVKPHRFVCLSRSLAPLAEQVAGLR